MQEISTPLLGRRRLEEERNGVSSHNLIDRNRDQMGSEDHEEDLDEEEEEGIRTDYGSGVYRYPHYLQPGHFTSLEKLMFFVSSILLILVCVFAGLYARSSQQDNNKPSIPVPNPKIPKNHTKKQITCLEPNCIITAAQILQDVDQELEPCDDFYAYTCNKWRQSHLIPDIKSKVDIPSLLTESIHHRLHQILNYDFDSFFVDTSSLPDPNTILDRQLFTKIQDFYISCMDQDAIEQKSITPLYPLFRSIRDYIPFNSRGSDVHRGLNDAIHYLSERNIWPMFELRVEPDVIIDSSKRSLSLRQGHVGLHHRAMYDDPEIMKVYIQVVTSILGIIFKKDTDNEFGWRSWSAVATARRIIEFEKRIAQKTLLNDQEQQPERWTIVELQERVPQIDWTQFIQPLTEPPTHVLIPHASFIDNLSGDVLSETNPRTLQMYFIWRLIWKNLEVLGEEFAAPKRKLDAKLSGIEPRATPERWETCIDMMDKSAMGVLLGRYYVTDRSRRQDIVHAKEIVEDLARSVIDVIKDRVPHLNWISKGDETTKDEIMKKLQSIEFQVGYSTLKPDIWSVISLSEYFGDVNMDPKDFFGNIMKSNRHQVKQQVWRALEEGISSSVWNPQSAQVSYNKELNKVIIPGGLLQPPFIDIEGPSYFYYGTIGWMIGHEITHGFDNIGRKYNHQGIFGSWWDNDTIKNLDSQNQCLIQQYQRQFDSRGETTFNNNFADLGGLSIVEGLLQKNFTENRLVIPGLKDWTRDQLAYIQFARMKCSKSTREYKQLNKNFAPDHYRVNGPLMNSDHFSSTFGCKVGSFMNPEVKKCQVW